MISFECPHCHHPIRVKEDAAGRRGTCNSCGAKLSVPLKSVPLKITSQKKESPKFSNTWITLGIIAVLMLGLWGFAYGVHAFSVSQIDKHRKWEPTPHPAIPEKNDKTLEYAYTTWNYAGPLDQRNDDSGDVFRLSMRANLYTCDISEKRLLELLPLEDEGVYSRILRIQIKPEDKWISHGPGTSWLLDGNKSVIDYSLGRQHGMQREWYPNGQIKLKRHWAYDEVLAQKMWDQDGNVTDEFKRPHYKWSEDE